MEDFFSALVNGVISMITGLAVSDYQHGQNISDWQMQNQYNEEMYNKYNSPSARYEQLKNAGLSDSAIGQALSGFNGSGTTIMSSPMQPTNISANLADMFGSITESGRFGNEKALNKQEIKLKGIESGLKGKELELFEKTFDALVQKPFLDLQIQNAIKLNYEADSQLKTSQYNLNDQLRQKYGVETDLLEIERYIKDGTKNKEIEYIENKVKLQASQLNLNSAQIQNITANILYIQKQIEAIDDLKDVRQKEAAEALFYSTFLKETGITYQVGKDAVNAGVDIIKAILNIFHINWQK